MRKSQVYLAKERKALLRVVDKFLPERDAVNIEHSVWWHTNATTPSVSIGVYVGVKEESGFDNFMVYLRESSFKQNKQILEQALRAYVKQNSIIE